jgi:hypothetical protein
MIVKKIILISIFLFGNLGIFLSLLLKEFTFGNLWYSVNANSLVGFQKYFESQIGMIYIFKLSLNDYLLYFLEMNIFFFTGFLTLLIPCFLLVKLT